MTTRKKSTVYAIFKNGKELAIARVAYLSVIAITMSGILFIVGRLNFVDSLIFALSSFAGFYIASFIIFARKRVHLEEEDGAWLPTCDEK